MDDICPALQNGLKELRHQKTVIKYPYAKVKYKIYASEDRMTILQHASFWTNEYDLILCKPTNWWMTVQDAKAIEHSCSRIAKDSVTLLDHPDDPGYIDGVFRQ